MVRLYWAGDKPGLMRFVMNHAPDAGSIAAVNEIKQAINSVHSVVPEKL